MESICQPYGLIPSMTRRGNCYDNAAVESFFGSFKKEKVRRHIFKTREVVRAASSMILRCFIIGRDAINT